MDPIICCKCPITIWRCPKQRISTRTSRV